MFVKINHATGFSRGGGRDVYAGEVHDIPTSEAVPLLSKGWVVEATPEEAAEARKRLAVEAKTRAAAAEAASAADDEEDESGSKGPGKKK